MEPRRRGISARRNLARTARQPKDMDEIASTEKLLELVSAVAIRAFQCSRIPLYLERRCTYNRLPRELRCSRTKFLRKIASSRA